MTGHTQARDWLAAELRRHGLAPAVIRAVLGGADTYAARASASAVAAERQSILESAESLAGLEAGALQAAQARITELEQLARDMLGRFCRVSDGYRARAGKVQVARWEAVLDPEPAAREADHG